MPTATVNNTARKYPRQCLIIISFHCRGRRGARERSTCSRRTHVSNRLSRQRRHGRRIELRLLPSARWNLRKNTRTEKGQGRQNEVKRRPEKKGRCQKTLLRSLRQELANSSGVPSISAYSPSTVELGRSQRVHPQGIIYDRIVSVT